MKRPLLPYYFILSVLMLVSSGLKSQHPFEDAAGERIQVFTDRTMYISSEKVFFSVVVFSVKDLVTDQYSRTFYCELITPSGTRIAGRKYLLENSSGQGCLTIPEETISGIYYLKFYTRFMRNAGTDEYKYIMLKIINPFKTEVLSAQNTFDTAVQPAKNVAVPATNPTLTILSSKKTFSPRELIRVNITGDSGNILSGRFCVSVIPESTDTNPYSPGKKVHNIENNEVYLPETRGTSLSGQLIGRESRKPVADAKINLSIIGDKDILVVHTDSTGRFFFALPDYYGKKDIFICADDLPGITPEILIDNDFCSRPVNLPSPRFTLNEEEMQAAFNLAVNSRITSVFAPDTIASESAGEEKIVSFYGKPTEVLVIDKYIELPTLEEYFTQLPGVVKLRTIQGRKQFRFYTTDDEMSMYDPLLLVDWVAVNDIRKILAMAPLEIQRIELVNAPYIKGPVTYGGIISFVSKKNDFAGIDLPKSGTFFNYTFLQSCSNPVSPDTLTAEMPDSRNTVYWNPDIQTNSDGAAGLSFMAPDTPGKYYILLRGMTRTGNSTISKETFLVTDK